MAIAMTAYRLRFANEEDDVLRSEGRIYNAGLTRMTARCRSASPDRAMTGEEFRVMAPL